MLAVERHFLPWVANKRTYNGDFEEMQLPTRIEWQLQSKMKDFHRIHKISASLAVEGFPKIKVDDVGYVSWL